VVSIASARSTSRVDIRLTASVFASLAKVNFSDCSWSASLSQPISTVGPADPVAFVTSR
jgi:hypothetical protein